MKPIKTALCSFGMSGWVFHAPFLQLNAGFNLYAVWERSKNLAVEKYPSIKTFRSLEKMLTDDSIELVIVNTPNATHFSFAKQALNAGKNVIIEKPFTVSVKEAEELITIAKKKKLILSAYQNRRYDSDFKTVKKVIGQQLLGHLVEVQFQFDRYKKELSPKIHKETPGEGGGILYDLGSHIIDQALQLFGMPTKLFADIQILRPKSRVDDYFEIILYYTKLRVRLKASYVVREPLPGYILHGMEGSFIKPRTDIQETELKKGIIPGKKNWGKEPQDERGLLHYKMNGKTIKKYITSEQGNYNDYYDGIFRAIRNGGPVPVSSQDAMNVIKIIETAFRSNKREKVEKV